MTRPTPRAGDPVPVCPDPVRRAVMKQKWLDLAYLHYDYEPDVVQGLLPAGLEVDRFDDRAWVGLIPFSMRDIGVPGLPAVPYLGSFPEINVRTYVRRNGVPGVWFFSLDVNRLLPALVARAAYRLPYCWGRASHRVLDGESHTTVERRWPSATRGAFTRIDLEVGEAISQPTAFDVWSSARWGLYSRGWGRDSLWYAAVDHPTWSLRGVRASSIDDSLITAAGLPASGEPVRCTFSSGVPVRIGRPRRVDW